MKFKIIALFLFLTANLIGQKTSIVTWNLKDFGKSRDDQEIHNIALQLRDHDLVAIQEIVAKDIGGSQAVARLVDELDRMGANWDYVISDPTQGYSGQRSERYAYLWKTKHIKKIGRPFLVNALQNKLIREPYYAIFEIRGKEIHLLNFHSQRHDEDPASEVAAITSLLLANPQNNWILLGDFNMNESHPCFKPLYNAGFKAALHNQKTTLKKKCVDGEYLYHAIDNIYYKLSNLSLAGSGVIDFVKDCEQLSLVRDGYSDHLGVWGEVE